MGEDSGGDALMKVDIVAPTGAVWSGQADQVRVPAHDGEMGILEGHTPLMALLSSGKVIIVGSDGRERSIDVEGGFVTVDTDTVSVLVDKIGKVDISE
ncbi:F0F1 ATP synthase subunit epsilon [Arcanobacterium haemolyticum]|nr:F0F1 ATP synthase subunit epsilon [Arcanobacterium haemolyticum]